MTPLRSRGALAAVLALALAGCGSQDPESSSSSTAGAAATSSPAGEATAEPASDEPFGEACPAVPADDPVATAASKTPPLSRLVDAVTQADLVDALNSAPAVTVLAPADPAFEAVPADALKALLADKARLTAVLTHHVIEGRLPPDRLAGEHTTLNGDTVTVEGSGEDFTIAAGGTVVGDADAAVLCGNLQTANATVYIIDQVLGPPDA